MSACFFCGGAAHPATGAQYTERVIACGPCVREFWTWVRRHTSRRWAGLYFYEHARAGTPRRVYVDWERFMSWGARGE